ncbi:MAG: hypothetical protein ACODAU_09275 [Myxococcota bacterium]
MTRAACLALLGALVLPGTAVAQDDEPPPWESGEAPPWETGVPPEPAEAEEEPDEEAGADVDLPPPGEDTERAYRPETGAIESTPLDDFGIEEREEDGETITVVPFDARGPVLYGAVGYEAADDLGHLVFSIAGGWTVWSDLRSLRVPGERAGLEGSATNVMLAVDLAPSVEADAATSFITIGGRVQQMLAVGDHLLMAQLGLGGRKDLDTSLGGVDLSFGVGYAYALAPFAIPIHLELVRHYSGVYPRKQWGARISVGWPIWLAR